MSFGEGLLDGMNALAKSMGGEVVAIKDREGAIRWYAVRKDGRTFYTNPSAEQILAWLDFRARFGIPLEAERRPDRRKGRLAR